MTFALHPQLAADTFPVGDLALSAVLLMNDDRFPWVILVPRRANMRDLIDLDEADAGACSGEIRLVSRAMKELFKPHKLNVAALGNMVPQLHIHIIARFAEDAAWPRPVWGVGEIRPYPEPLRAERIEMLRAALKIA
ncbi:HIT family protein [Terrarubrum flagellatum]|uniref:HIT family protein n=1 Tax=Terrirubrum flagellatum TaxID=2895980 RepID=UPI0031454E4C